MFICHICDIEPLQGPISDWPDELFPRHMELLRLLIVKGELAAYAGEATRTSAVLAITPTMAGEMHLKNFATFTYSSLSAGWLATVRYS